MRVIEEDICCTSTKIFIGRDIAGDIIRKEVHGKALLIRQQAVEPRHIINALDGNIYEITIPGGEYVKDIETVLSIVRFLSEKGFQRRDYIIAVGGGALTDIAGFVASIYMRGIRLINIPTTILGMVDAALGGKNAVNFQGIKNIIGSFYQPHIVISDLLFLETLPQREFVNGLAEAIKYGIVLDYELFKYMYENSSKILERAVDPIEFVIYRSTINKISIVKQDPYEQHNVRVVLNYGHTVGHAIESATDFAIPHGTAVAVGMVYEALVGRKLGVTNDETVVKLINILDKYGLPKSLNDLGVEVDVKRLYNAMAKDKKRYGEYITIPLPTSLGSWIPYRISINDLFSAVRECLG